MLLNFTITDRRDLANVSKMTCKKNGSSIEDPLQYVVQVSIEWLLDLVEPILGLDDKLLECANIGFKFFVSFACLPFEPGDIQSFFVEFVFEWLGFTLDRNLMGFGSCVRGIRVCALGSQHFFFSSGFGDIGEVLLSGHVQKCAEQRAVLEVSFHEVPFGLMR